MTGRVRSVLAIVAAATLALVAGCSAPSASGASTPSPTPPPGVGTATDFALPAALRKLTFTTSTGAPVSLASLAGKIVVLSDVMTLCQETCPLDTSSLVQVARDENSAGHQSQVVYLSLTVDPARDTVPQIAAYRALYTPVPPNWVVATGSARDVSAIWKDLGVYTKKVPEAQPPAKNWRTGVPLTYDIQHSDALFFLGTDGRVRFVIEGTPKLAPSSVPTTLRKFLSDTGLQNLETPSPDAWTPAQADQVLGWMMAG